MASKTTLNSSVAFQDAAGNPLAGGYLIFRLNMGAKVVSSGEVVNAVNVKIALDSTGNVLANQSVWGNDNLMPTGTMYVVTIFSSNDSLVRGPENWIIAGASPVDLATITSSLVPDPGLASPVIQNPVANQTISQPAATTFTVGGSGAWATTVPGTHSAAETFSGGVFGLTPKFQQFTSSGTFTIPSGITAVKVTVVGGGGAGGGGGSTSGMGLGGGAGAAAIAYLSALTPGNTIAVTVGTGGAGVSGNSGNAGTASSIASGTQTITTVTANGGSGGTGNTAGVQAGAPGGTATGGTLNFSGNTAMPGGASPLTQTPGAPSIFGGAPQVNAAGGAPGAGGGGNQGNPSTGGAGANGIVIFEWVQ